jgi:hypothetical protein
MNFNYSISAREKSISLEGDAYFEGIKKASIIGIDCLYVVPQLSSFDEEVHRFTNGRLKEEYKGDIHAVNFVDFQNLGHTFYHEMDCSRMDPNHRVPQNILFRVISTNQMKLEDTLKSVDMDLAFVIIDGNQSIDLTQNTIDEIGNISSKPQRLIYTREGKLTKNRQIELIDKYSANAIIEQGDIQADENPQMTHPDKNRYFPTYARDYLYTQKECTNSIQRFKDRLFPERKNQSRRSI